MLPDLDKRYPVTQLISHQDDRLVCLAEDRLSGRQVVVKTGARAAILHELSALLSLPPGVGPAVLDAVWTRDRDLLMVLEHLPGRTLDRLAATLEANALPALVCSIAAALACTHRAGVIHVDLKPSNILLLKDSGRIDLRLLDFGFSRSLSGTLEEDEASCGGTPPFTAPEVLKGWAFDGRADLYALGMTLVAVFPKLVMDPLWAELIDQLCDPSPSRRFPDAAHLHREVTDRFRLSHEEGLLPRMGGGPLRGREEEVSQLLALTCGPDPAARLLLCAAPGTGLTRFMLEGIVAIAHAQGPPARLIDLGDRAIAAGAARWHPFIEERVGVGETILCGVPDPSPGFRWLEEGTGAVLRELAATNSTRMIRLRRLDASAVAEIVAQGLGSGGVAVEELGRRLWDRTEGDLREASAGLLTSLKHWAREGKPCEEPTRGMLDDALASWAPPVPDPAYSSVPVRLRAPLQVAARAGESATREVLTELLVHFCGATALDELLEHGYLEEQGPGRLAFVTRALRRSALADALANEIAVLEWLHTRIAPDPAFISETLEGCHRARRLGDRASEARHLAAALQDAARSRRWHDIRVLCEYPDPVTGIWSLERARQKIGQLSELLGRDWPPDRLRSIMAQAFFGTDATIAIPLLDELAAGDDAQLAAQALVELAERDVARAQQASFADHMRSLEALAEYGSDSLRGTIDRIRAWHAQTQGRHTDAMALARRAMERLRGSGSVQENLCQQLLAVLEFECDPRQGTARMQLAQSRACDPEQSAQTSHNLAMMCAHTGDLEGCARAAQTGIAQLAGRGPSQRLLLLRLRRAWAWASLDRIPDALREARSLLALAVVRQHPQHAVLARVLTGFCLLHQSNSRGAITELARAWETAAQGVPRQMHLDTLLYLVEGLLDLRTWDLVGTFGPEMSAALDAEDDPTRRVAVRVEALRAQAAGRVGEAAAVLAAHAAEAQQDAVPVNVARYLYHWGLVRLAELEAGRSECVGRDAVRILSEAVTRLDGPAYGYYRARASLACAQAQHALGESDHARRSLAYAIDLARRIGSRGLLAEALQARAAWDLRRRRDRQDRGGFDARQTE